MDKRDIRRKFGQNYLSDPAIIFEMGQSVSPYSGDQFLEVGPGMGALTKTLNKPGIKVKAIDVDRENIEYLSKNLNGPAEFNFVNDDILKTSLDFLNEGNFRIVGNLPYNISTPLIFHILKSNSLFEDLHIMVQKEVADRMISGENKKTYGRLSIAIQARCNIKKLFNISPNAFFPKPKVISSLVRITPNNNLDEKILDSLDDILKTVFSKRRKKISNGLKDYFSKEEIKAMGIDCENRPENLTVKDYIKLSNKRCV